MNTTDIYRQAIKRTASTVDVAWSNEGDAIVVKCAGKTFIHLILSDSNDAAPQFLSISEDPVVVTLTDEERQQLERAI